MSNYLDTFASAGQMDRARQVGCELIEHMISDHGLSLGEGTTPHDVVTQILNVTLPDYAQDAAQRGASGADMARHLDQCWRDTQNVYFNVIARMWAELSDAYDHRITGDLGAYVPQHATGHGTYIV